MMRKKMKIEGGGGGRREEKGEGKGSEGKKDGRE